MRTFNLFAIASLALLLAACSGVETRPSDTAEFVAGNYHYYKWRSEPLANKTGSSDPIYQIDPIMRAVVDEELAAKGYELDPQRAQFSVDYIFASGLRMGERSTTADNLSTYPGQIPNRNIDQASIDNAYALGGVKETSNVALQFNDVTSKDEVWHVVVTKIVEDANQADAKAIRKSVKSAVSHGLRQLPNAN